MNKWYRSWLTARARRLDRKAAKLRARVRELTPKRPRPRGPFIVETEKVA